MRRWTVNVCPECHYLTAIVNAPVHEQGCSHPDTELVTVLEAPWNMVMVREGKVPNDRTIGTQSDLSAIRVVKP